jgi:Flp pilus assembly protein TadG
MNTPTRAAVPATGRTATRRDARFSWRRLVGAILATMIGLLIATASQAQSNNAEFVSQSIPASLVMGQTATATVTLKNTGTTTWTAASNYRLGTQNPGDNKTWGLHRVPLAAGEAIAPGQQKTFSFSIKAPATAGTYNLQTRMLREGVEWFGASSTNFVVSVAPKPNNAEFVSQSIPASLIVGKTATATITLKNTGTTTWTAATNYRLGTQNPGDNKTWGLHRVPLAAGEAIAPGQQKTFSFSIKAPASAGTYNLQTRMLREGVEWFGASSTNTPINVLAETPRVYYLHTDHLDTPRLVTDAQNKTVWRNGPLAEPFGNTPPEEDPDGDGNAFTMNLRFPGQYADKETNLHQNGARDYDPMTGRYR